MSRSTTALRRYSILIHRWMGVGFCVLFVVWFVSGIVLMYWDFPRWSNVKRLPGMEVLDASQLQVSPEEAFARLADTRPPDRVRINMLDGRPVYRFHYGNKQRIVYADDAAPMQTLDHGGASRIAAAWSRQPESLARFEGLREVDQWTVHPSVRPFGPFLKYAWPDGTHVYVSNTTAEVVQHTTRGERVGAWFGAIPHWFYVTPIRDDPELWDALVTWSSGIGTVMTVFGLVVGLWLYSPSRKRYRYPWGRSSIPYTGQKRWHTMLGLIFGLFACTWGLSGMLSMSPFAWLRSSAPVNLTNVLPGGSWHPEPFSERPRDILHKVGSALIVKELELTFVGGEPFYIAVEAIGRSLIIPPNRQPSHLLDEGHLTKMVAKAAQPYELAEVRTVTEYESYYVDRDFRHGFSLPVLFTRLNDAEGSMYYVDLATGKVMKSYSTALRWNRWLYNGLHSLDVPWLYRNRPAWDIVVLVLMLGGTALCITSVVIGWRRVRQHMAMRAARSRYAVTPEVELPRRTA